MNAPHSPQARPFDPSAIFSQTNFGNTLTVPGFTGVNAAGRPIPPNAGPSVSGGNSGQNWRQRILTLDAASVLANSGHRVHFPELLAANWVVSLDAEVSWVDGPGVSDQPACPLTAFIGYGSGGAQIDIEVDVFPGNVVSLPGTVAQIDIGWSPVVDYGLDPAATLISDDASVQTGGHPYLPTYCQVSAVAQRSTSAPSAPAFKTIYMPRRSSGSVNSYSVIYNIPNLARLVRAYDQPGATVGSSGLYDAGATYSFRNRYTGGGSSSRNKLITGATAFSLLEAGIVIPKNSSQLIITVPAGTAIGGNSGSGSLPKLEFELAL